MSGPFAVPSEADRWPIVLGLLKLSRRGILSGVWLTGTRLAIRPKLWDEITPITWKQAKELIEFHNPKPIQTPAAAEPGNHGRRDYQRDVLGRRRAQKVS